MDEQGRKKELPKIPLEMNTALFLRQKLPTPRLRLLIPYKEIFAKLLATLPPFTSAILSLPPPPSQSSPPPLRQIPGIRSALPGPKLRFPGRDR